MSRLAEISHQLALIGKQQQTLSVQHRMLEAERRTILSTQFIAANNIKRTDVQMSSGEGIPYHNTVWQFVDWLRQQAPLKRFAEWNHSIYFTTDLLNGDMAETGGCIDGLTD